jgi:hypothetical protein
VLPDKDLEWQDVLVGAVVTAFLFSIGKFLIGLYIGSSATVTCFAAGHAANRRARRSRREFDRNLRRHVVPIELSSGTFDFDKSDTVGVQKRAARIIPSADLCYQNGLRQKSEAVQGRRHPSKMRTALQACQKCQSVARREAHPQNA